MTRRCALMITMLVLAGCSREDTATPGAPAAGGTAAPAAETSAAEDRIAKIPILPGYKYYVGGPTMKRDAYGRYRLAGFNGEVEQPPSRGMIFGAKREGDQLEYRVWGNGVLLGLHKGIMRDGVFWQEYAEGYRDGKLVARERTVNDDAAKRSKLTIEDIDRENGEVIRVKEGFRSYLPRLTKPDDLEDEDEDDENAAQVPLEAVKEAAPSAPAQPPKDAAK